MDITLYQKYYTDMTYKSVTEILQAIKKKKISASEITSEYFERIKASDGDLNCFITLTE